MANGNNGKKVIGIYELTGCAGCALEVINLEDKVLKVFDAFEVAVFLMAKSDNDYEKEVDVALVDGSVSTEEEIEKIKKIREKAKVLVALGDCACFGGIQAGMEEEDFEKEFKKVYGDNKLEVVKPVFSKPIDAYVKVDFYLPGCPPELSSIERVLGDIWMGNIPQEYYRPVCAECRWAENECLLFENKVCLGPITRGGCNARCPSAGIPCIGCRGPVRDAQVHTLFNVLKEKFKGDKELLRKMKIFAYSGFKKFLKDLKK